MRRRVTKAGLIGEHEPTPELRLTVGLDTSDYAERHASHASDERLPVVVGERISMFRLHRVDPVEIVIGEDDRLMRYRMLLRLDSETRRFTCATVAAYGSNPLGRLYVVAGLPAHRWFVRSTMRRFAGG